MSLNIISRYRSVLFGISIISIILFHYCEDYVNAFQNGNVGSNLIVFGYYKMISSLGVEVFIFLSGLGLFYSMSNNSNVIRFYEKRVKRLIVPYVFVGIIFWGVFDLILNKEGITRFIKDFTFVTFFTEGQRTIWFIGVIFIFYLVFPLVYKLILSQAGVIKTLILIIGIYGINYSILQLWPNIYYNIEIGIMRFPIFILGALCAYLIKNDVQNQNKIMIFFAIAIGLALKLADVFVDMPQYWSRIITTFYAIALILIVCIIVNKLHWMKFNSAMEKVGEYSLELYMIHVCLRKIMKSIGVYTCEFHIYIGIIIISIILSTFLHKSINLINFKYQTQQNNNIY